MAKEQPSVKRPEQETLTMPRVNKQAIRDHLQRFGDRLGRSQSISAFVSEAVRRLISDDLKVLRDQETAAQHGLDGDERAASWEHAPDVRKTDKGR